MSVPAAADDDLVANNIPLIGLLWLCFRLFTLLVLMDGGREVRILKCVDVKRKKQPWNRALLTKEARRVK